MTREDTTARIAAAARLEFAQLGYAGARIDRIAQRAGVNKQLIYYYFGSKEALHREILARVLREIDELFQDHTSGRNPPERVRALLTSLLRYLRRDTGALSFLTRPMNNGDRGQEEPLAGLAHLHDHLRSLVSEGQGLGYFRDDADPDFASMEALVLIVGFLLLEPLLKAHAPDDAWLNSVNQRMLAHLNWAP